MFPSPSSSTDSFTFSPLNNNNHNDNDYSTTTSAFPLPDPPFNSGTNPFQQQHLSSSSTQNLLSPNFLTMFGHEQDPFMMINPNPTHDSNSRSDHNNVLCSYPYPLTNNNNTVKNFPFLLPTEDPYHQHAGNPPAADKDNNNYYINTYNALMQQQHRKNKERHSKIETAGGVRDRRIRLSIPTARKFFDLQDVLGFDKPSQTIDWLLSMSFSAIQRLYKDAHSHSRALYTNTTSTTAAESAAAWNLQAGHNNSSSNKAPTEKETVGSRRAKARARARERTSSRSKLLLSTKQPAKSQSSATLVVAAPSPHHYYNYHQNINNNNPNMMSDKQQQQQLGRSSSSTTASFGVPQPQPPISGIDNPSTSISYSQFFNTTNYSSTPISGSTAAAATTSRGAHHHVNEESDDPSALMLMKWELKPRPPVLPSTMLNRNANVLGKETSMYTINHSQH